MKMSNMWTKCFNSRKSSWICLFRTNVSFPLPAGFRAGCNFEHLATWTDGTSSNADNCPVWHHHCARVHWHQPTAAAGRNCQGHAGVGPLRHIPCLPTSDFVSRCFIKKSPFLLGLHIACHLASVGRDIPAKHPRLCHQSHHFFAVADQFTRGNTLPDIGRTLGNGANFPGLCWP